MIIWGVSRNGGYPKLAGWFISWKILQWMIWELPPCQETIISCLIWIQNDEPWKEPLCKNRSSHPPIGWFSSWICILVMTIPLLMGSHSESSSSTIILIPIIPIWLPFTIITSNTIITIIIIVFFYCYVLIIYVHYWLVSMMVPKVCMILPQPTTNHPIVSKWGGSINRGTPKLMICSGKCH